MGKQTKAGKARIQSLNIQQKSENSRVEDVTDSEDEEYLPEDREDLFLCIFRCVLISFYQICKQISSIYQCILYHFDQFGRPVTCDQGVRNFGFGHLSGDL